MELFIKVSFWCAVICTGIRLFDMSVSTWPKTRKHGLGEKVTETLIGIGIGTWAGILLYWR